MFEKIITLFRRKPVTNSAKSTFTPKKRKGPEATRIGELGEYKINIQLDQLPKECKYASDIMVRNPKSRSGFSQIDHIVISPYGLFVIETKNYNGEIKGNRTDSYWWVNKRFKLYNPLKQNYGHIRALETLIKGYPDLVYVSMVSFTMRCRFSIEPALREIGSNELVVYDVELSEFISRKILRMKTTAEQLTLKVTDMLNIHRMIQEANITDPALRAQHIERVKRN
ncbi:MAG: nuclease-related domain-containing protein [Paenibacillaceae bacterium]